MTTYSAFFSSGLLAPHNVNVHSNDNLRTPTHSRPISPAIDIEMDRSTTPTPIPIHPPKTPQPRLRRRRSSLTLEASGSPIHNIKSPIRNAAAAGALQRHIDLNMHVSPARNRSGSLSLGMMAEDVFSVPAAGDENGLAARMSRMRSGSVGTALRQRRSKHTRRNVPAFTLPAAAPPPTAPLPSIPISRPKVPSISITRHPLTAHNSDAQPASESWDSKNHLATPVSPSLPDSDTEGESSKTGTARPRSYSFENGYVIDEEMKEG